MNPICDFDDFANEIVLKFFLNRKVQLYAVDHFRLNI